MLNANLPGNEPQATVDTFRRRRRRQEHGSKLDDNANSKGMHEHFLTEHSLIVLDHLVPQF